MAIALLTSVVAGSAGGGTSGSIDTTGANFLVAAVGSYGSGSISDSKSNTWTGLTLRSGINPDVRLYYVKNATVGTGHTFTFGAFNRICVASFSGVDTTAPFDVENGVSGLSSFAPGSITPSVNNELVVACCSQTAMDGSTTVTASMSIIVEAADGGGGQPAGNALAYIVQTTAGAINPTFGGGPSGVGSLAIASFKESAAAATSYPLPSLSAQRRAILAR